MTDWSKLLETAISSAGLESGQFAKAKIQAALRELEQLRAQRLPYCVTADEIDAAWHDTHDRTGQEPTREALNALLAARNQ